MVQQPKGTHDTVTSDATGRALLPPHAWRCIGPHRGGRVVAVAGDPHDPRVFYFGACAGGVWKTTDGGTFWENVSDAFFSTAAVGALAGSLPACRASRVDPAEVLREG